ncbi:putative tartrate transporter [Smittium mucronatum]|uniref:Putative tartrate transporter n=1 Tax=Smittium mucronatum TaxID=133383 RepID=A0A1R0H954_9FUNG|nr:putative tartrate transporter [Smittium mucronatum]
MASSSPASDTLAFKSKLDLHNQNELSQKDAKIIKSYLKKCDRRVLPILILIYIFSLIDRATIGAALANGLRDGLDLSETEEYLSTAIFSIFYILCEIPSNVLLKKMKPHIWFSAIGILWSVVCMMQAFVKTGSQFVVLRALLGIFESGFSPGVIAYLSYWYTRSELGSRMILFYMSMSVSGIIGSPLNAFLASRKDYPEDAKFLTAEERDLAIYRLENEHGIASKTSVSYRQILSIMSDWKVWTFSIILLGAGVGPTVGSIFGPSIVASFGFSGVNATYLSGLPAISGLVGLLVGVYFMNKVEYWILVSIFSSINIIGYSIFAFSSKKAVRLVSSFISGFGGLPILPITIAWCMGNQGGLYKGMITSAIIISVSATSGIFVPKLFLSIYYPKFTMGHSVAIAIMSLPLILSILMGLYFRLENARRDKISADVSHLSEKAQRDLYDNHPKFSCKKFLFIMSTSKDPELLKQYETLRTEIKKWETQFKSDHGRLAGKEDLSSLPEIGTLAFFFPPPYSP